MKRIIMVGALAMSLMACCAKKEGSTAANTTNDSAGKTVSGDTGNNSGQQRFNVLEQSSHGGRENAANIIIKDQQALYDLYKELSLGTAPKVDFNQQQVVAVFMGQKSSGGYSIGIDKVTMDGGTAEVVIKETYPAKGAMVTSALTSPYCIAAIPKAKEVIFLQDPPPMMQD